MASKICPMCQKHFSQVDSKIPVCESCHIEYKHWGEYENGARVCSQCGGKVVSEVCDYTSEVFFECLDCSKDYSVEEAKGLPSYNEINKELNMSETKRPLNYKGVEIVKDGKQNVKISIFVKNENGEIALREMKERSFLAIKRNYSLEDIEIGAIVNGNPIVLLYGAGDFWVTSGSSLENAKQYAIQEERLFA